MLLSIIVPAHEEERTIEAVLAQLAELELAPIGFEREVVVCVDGGRDSTVRRVKEFALGRSWIRVLEHETNRGKGAAIRTALAEVRGDFVLIQDADLEYDVADYPAIARALAGGADAVFGSRFRKRWYPEGMHPANFVANRVLTLAANVLYDHAITDEATCLKAVRTDLLRSLDLECERFEFCPEVTAKLGLREIRVVEVPVSYRARSVGEGKKVRWTDGVVALSVLVEHRFPILRGALLRVRSKL